MPNKRKKNKWLVSLSFLKMQLLNHTKYSDDSLIQLLIERTASYFYSQLPICKGMRAYTHTHSITVQAQSSSCNKWHLSVDCLGYYSVTHIFVKLACIMLILSRPEVCIRMMFLLNLIQEWLKVCSCVHSTRSLWKIAGHFRETSLKMKKMSKN